MLITAFIPCIPGVGAAGAEGVREGPVLDMRFLPPEEGEVGPPPPPPPLCCCCPEAEGSNTLSKVTPAAAAAPPPAAALEEEEEEVPPPPTQEELAHPPPRVEDPLWRRPEGEAKALRVEPRRVVDTPPAVVPGGAAALAAVAVRPRRVASMAVKGPCVASSPLRRDTLYLS